jgi:fibulin 1/2
MNNNTCDDEDECAFTGNDCIVNGKECFNTIGSYRCVDHNIVKTDDAEEDLFGKPSEIDDLTEGDDEVRPDESGECPDGWMPGDNTRTCINVDECETNIHNCFGDETCIDTEGSYKCEVIECPEGQKNQNGKCVDGNACNPGFERNNKTNKCENINECKLNATVCSEGLQCFDLEGSFECVNNTCEPGYRISRGYFGSKCHDINECDEDLHNCTNEQTCTNLPGSFVCDCRTGFEVNSLTGMCEDIDECSSEIIRCGDRSSFCNNTIGSYECVCNTGYRQSNLGSCIDINECSDVTHNCPDNSICTNKPGSYDCNCYPGYVLKPDNNVTCVLIEKECHGIKEGDKCTCPDGFQLKTQLGDESCMDIDECESNGGNCETETFCVNTFGSYKCVSHQCPENYHPLGEHLPK